MKNFTREAKFIRCAACIIVSTMFSFPVFSDEGWEINLQSSLDVNLFMNVDRTERLYDYEYRAGFDNPPLLSIDMELFHGPWTFITEGSILSLRSPMVFDKYSLFSPLVKLAFLEYEDDFIYFSAGRRKQSIGVSDYSQFVNKDMPFYDGVNISVGRGFGFRFDSLVSVSNMSWINSYTETYVTSPFVDGVVDSHDEQYDKYFIYHALSYVGKTWYAMVGEPAILGNSKTPPELSIFTNIHNENSKWANVGIEFQFAKMFGDTLLTHITGAIDDLPMLPEHSEPPMLVKTPNALSIGGGIRWHAIQGDRFVYPSFDADRGIRRNIHFGEMSGGLIISFDYMGASRWMYVRTNLHHSSLTFFPGFQSFYNYFFNPYFVSKPDHYALSYGSKYGGDSQLLVLKGSYESKKTKFTGVVELALLGQDAQERFTNINYWGASDLSTDPNAENYAKDWISSGNIQPVVTIELSMERGLADWISIYTGAHLVVSSFLETKFRANLGATVQF